jgi:hypothetical protein
MMPISRKIDDAHPDDGGGAYSPLVAVVAVVMM